MPSCVAVARGTLDPLAQVRILARQPFVPHPSYSHRYWMVNENK